MLSLGRFINNCCRPIKCSSTNVLDLAVGLGLCLRSRQSSALISTRAINVRRDKPTEGLPGLSPLYGLGLLESSQSTELGLALQYRHRPRPSPGHLKPDLDLSFYLLANTSRPTPCSRPSVGNNLKLSSFQTRVISESPWTIGHGSFKLPPCSETSFDHTVDTPSISIQLPAVPNTHEKHAARLIVIRRRKMKKHKLKKLRKKMKFDWAKVRQGREMRKEKSFQAELLAQIKEAQKFDAAQYVSEKLRKAHEVPIPRTWKGKRLPEFIIKEKLGIK